jgi:hypothetical protein
MTAKNILMGPLEDCGHHPVTGFYRDGCCHSGSDDAGVHSVCAVMTEEFLDFTRRRGNDLSTPLPAYGFPGLKPGDRWCLCASRWVEALLAGMAPPIVPEATHIKTLQFIRKDELIRHSVHRRNGSGYHSKK